MSIPTKQLISYLLNSENLNGLSCSVANLSSFLYGNNLNILYFDKNFKSASEPNPTIATTLLSELNNIKNESITQNYLRNDYDYDGAIFYIFIVMFWYSLLIVIFIGIDTKNNVLSYNYDDEDSDSNSAQNWLRSRKGENIKREALGIFFFFLY